MAQQAKNWWKCLECGYTFQSVPPPPEACPNCHQKCVFVDVTCYRPDCGPGSPDPRLMQTPADDRVSPSGESREQVLLGMSVHSAKTLVLGLGNPILTDDGVGIHVTRAVASRLASQPGLGDGICFSEASVGGLRLLEVLSGYDRVILVDAIQTPDGLPGDICQLAPAKSRAIDGGDLRSSLHAGSTHDLTLQGALAWGRQSGMALPDDEAILIVAIEAQDVLTFGETCTPKVAAAIPRSVDLVLGVLGADWKLKAGS